MGSFAGRVINVDKVMIFKEDTAQADIRKLSLNLNSNYTIESIS